MHSWPFIAPLCTTQQDVIHVLTDPISLVITDVIHVLTDPISLLL
jgi:hypothetical protein